MSQTAVAEFITSASKNPALLSRITSAAAGRSPSEAGDAIAALGAEAGFRFSGSDALAYREKTLAGLQSSSNDDEDSILDGVRGGVSTGDTYLDNQITGLQAGLSAGGGRTGSAMGVELAVGAAQGDLGGAAINTANNLNDTRSSVQQFFSSVFSGW